MTKSEQFRANIEADPTASFQLKMALTDAADRDVLDALGDAEQLLAYCQQRAIEAGIA